MKTSFLFVPGVLFTAVISLVMPAHGAPKPTLTWSFVSHNDSSDTPHTNVFLTVNGKRVLILKGAEESFRVLSPSDYKDAAVPAKALTACSGFYGGAGDDLYVIQNAKSLTVYRRETDEQADIPPYHRLKSIPLR